MGMSRTGGTPKRRALGILGGMGPRATHYFVGEFLRAFEDLHKPRSDQGYPDFIVLYACSTVDRTAAIEDDPSALHELLETDIRFLCENGCDQIVLPCVSAHAVLGDLLSRYPVVDVREVVTRHVAANRPGAVVGVLATRGSRKAGQLNQFAGGNPVVTLTPDRETRLMDVIYNDVKDAGGNASELADRLLEFAATLRREGADVVVAGCTEVEMVLAPGAPPEVLLPLRLTASHIVAKSWPVMPS
jgi:aspartate racemase